MSVFDESGKFICCFGSSTSKWSICASANNVPSMYTQAIVAIEGSINLFQTLITYHSLLEIAYIYLKLFSTQCCATPTGAFINRILYKIFCMQLIAVMTTIRSS